MMPAKGSEIVDVAVEVTVETDKAWKVISCMTNRTAWIPKSLAEMDAFSNSTRTGTLTMPTWLAEREDLV